MGKGYYPCMKLQAKTKVIRLGLYNYRYRTIGLGSMPMEARDCRAMG
jgi:hypothetical protein